MIEIGLGHYLSLGAIIFFLGVIGIFLNRKNIFSRTHRKQRKDMGNIMFPTSFRAFPSHQCWEGFSKVCVAVICLAAIIF